MRVYEIFLIVSAIIASAIWSLLLYRMRAYAILLFLLMVLGVSEAYLLCREYEFKWHLIAAILPALGASIYAMIRIRLRLYKQINALEKEQAREAQKEKIRSGAKEMAELYRNDPELKELNEFVGDYRELSSQNDFVLDENTQIISEVSDGTQHHLL